MIPDEAVEAAFGSYVGGNEVTGPDIAGDFLTREQLRTILEAAAPHLMAVAVESAANSFSASSPEGEYSSTPTQVIEWLREYAASYREAA